MDAGADAVGCVGVAWASADLDAGDSHRFCRPSVGLPLAPPGNGAHFGPPASQHRV